jgi:hypothetical protein
MATKTAQDIRPNDTLLLGGHPYRVDSIVTYAHPTTAGAIGMAVDSKGYTIITLWTDQILEVA